MIQIHQLHITYRRKNEQIHVLQDVNLEVQQGEWVALLGPSGSGKSSLLQCLGGVLEPHQGQVLINGTNLYLLKLKERQRFRRQRIGFVYQDLRLLPQCNALENVMIPLIPYEKRNLIQEKAEKLLTEVGLAHRLYHHPEELSGGEQQRVAIARALMSDPELLLCDEPTGNLDIRNRDQLMTLFQQMHKQGQTIIMSTHDHAVADYADHMYSLSELALVRGRLT